MLAGTKSRPNWSPTPSASIRELRSTAARQKGTVWKYVPCSPAGSSPSRLNSDAI